METAISFIGENQQMIYIIILAIFVGFVLIANVPSVLHCHIRNL